MASPRSEGIHCLLHHQQIHITKNKARRGGDHTFFVHCPECVLDLRIHFIRPRTKHAQDVWLVDWWRNGEYNETRYPIDIITELGDLVRQEGPLEPPPYLLAQIEEMI